MKADTATVHQTESDTLWDPQRPRMHVGTQRFTTFEQAFAFQFGYIKAMIQAVHSES